MRSIVVNLILGFVFIAIGLVICIFEFSNYTFNSIPNESILKQETYQYNLYNDNIINFFIPYDEYTIITDNNLDNKMLIKIKYIDGIEKIHINEDLNNIQKSISIYITTDEININKIFNRVINDLKGKKINYYINKEAVEIIINSKDLNKIKINKRH